MVGRYRLAQHQIRMLREARPGSDGARLRSELETITAAPALCPSGHRVSISMGECYTLRELKPGVYEYVIGPCAELSA